MFVDLGFLCFLWFLVFHGWGMNVVSAFAALSAWPLGCLSAHRPLVSLVMVIFMGCLVFFCLWCKGFVFGVVLVVWWCPCNFWLRGHLVLVGVS